MINLNVKGLTMEDASQQFYKYVCAVCKAEGLNPDREVFITDDYRSYEQISKGQILVSWESGPFEWGVNFSLGYHENIYDPEFADKNLSWYLESYYRFDVVFTHAPIVMG